MTIFPLLKIDEERDSILPRAMPISADAPFIATNCLKSSSDILPFERNAPVMVKCILPVSYTHLTLPTIA